MWLIFGAPENPLKYLHIVFFSNYTNTQKKAISLQSHDGHRFYQHHTSLGLTDYSGCRNPNRFSSYVMDEYVLIDSPIIPIGVGKHVFVQIVIKISLPRSALQKNLSCLINLFLLYIKR